MASREAGNSGTEQILVRVPRETYTALQLAQPFERRRSMQDLVSAIIDDFLEALRHREPGFETALTGLREAETRTEGVLARRTPGDVRAARSGTS